MTAGAPTRDPTGPGGGRDTRRVRDKAERMARARRERDAFWRHVVHVGVLGWVFILPVLIGAVAGRLIERWTGTRGAAVAGLLLGLVAGALATYTSVRRSLRDDDTHEDKREGGGS